MSGKSEGETARECERTSAVFQICGDVDELEGKRVGGGASEQEGGHRKRSTTLCSSDEGSPSLPANFSDVQFGQRQRGPQREVNFSPHIQAYTFIIPLPCSLTACMHESNALSRSLCRLALGLGFGYSYFLRRLAS